MSIFESRHRTGLALGMGAGTLALAPLGGMACDGEDVGPAPQPPRLAFQSGRDGNWEIYVMDVDGGVVRPRGGRPG